jgi:hypothetical protein
LCLPFYFPVKQAQIFVRQQKKTEQGAGFHTVDQTIEAEEVVIEFQNLTNDLKKNK